MTDEEIVAFLKKSVGKTVAKVQGDWDKDLHYYTRISSTDLTVKTVLAILLIGTSVLLFLIL